jgi:hypothetical protein
MKQIYFDVGVENLLFIRYNPDSYKTMDNQKPWKKPKRHDFLLKYLNEQQNHVNLGVVYLFYDGFINPPEIDLIDPYL